MSRAEHIKLYLFVILLIMNLSPLFAQTPDTLIHDSIAHIEFEPSAKQNFGFDAFSKGKQHIFYQHLPTQTGKTYHVPWKSIAEGKTDLVDVKLKYLFNGFTRKNLHFETSTGQPVKYKLINSEAIYRLQIKGEQTRSKQGKTYSILAYYKKDGQDCLVGKLNIKSYPQIKKNIAIVPVNGADVDINELEKYINDIFKQAVAKIKITEIPLTIPWDSMDLNALTEFEAHQQRLELYKRHLNKNITDSIQADYILFLFEKSGNNTLNAVTYENQPYGIFYLEKGAKENIYSQITQTVAHGCSKLRHSWEMGAGSQNGTDNLMDYKGGTDLYVYQWQNIHDPVGGLGWFQDAEEGKLTSYGSLAVASFKGAERSGCYETDGDGLGTFISPAGFPVTVPAQGDLIFAGKDFDFENDGSEAGQLPDMVQCSQGVLLGFTHQNILYAARFNKAGTTFEGYYGNDFYLDTYTKTLTDGFTAQLYDPDKKCCVSHTCGLTLAKLIEYNYPIDTDVYLSEGTVDHEVDAAWVKGESLGSGTRGPLVKESFEPLGTDIVKVDIGAFNQIAEKSILDMADDLVKAVNNNPTNVSDSRLYGDDYFHIVNTDMLRLSVGLDKYRILDDKLQFLQSETGTEIYVIYEYVPFMLEQNGNSNNIFAKKVYEKAISKLPSNRRDKIVLITVPYTDAFSNTNIAIKSQYVMPGIHDPGNNVSSGFYRQQQYTHTWELILNAYKYIPKPYRKFIAVLNADGSISPHVYEENGNVTGKTVINVVEFRKNPGWDAIKQKADVLKQAYQSYALNANTSNQNILEQALNEYFMAQYIYELEVLAIQEQYKDHPIDQCTALKAKKIFKERFIPDYYLLYAQKQAFEDNGFSNWLNTLQITFTSNTGTVDYSNLDEVCYNYSWLDPVDPIVYTAIDIAGLIPVVESFADLAGVGYALVRGDTEQAITYSIGVFIVGGGGALVIKTLSSGAKVIKTGTKVFYRGAIWVVDNATGNLRKLDDLLTQQLNLLSDFIRYNNLPQVQLSTVGDFNRLLMNNKISPEDIGRMRSMTNDADKTKLLKELTGGTRGEIYDKIFKHFSKFEKDHYTLVDKITRKIQNDYPKLIDKLDGNVAELLVKAGDGNVDVLARLDGMGDDVLNEFIVDIGKKPDLIDVFAKENGGYVDAYRIMFKMPDNRLKKDALEAVVNLKKNPGISAFGLSDEIIGNIYGWGNKGVQVGYREIIENIDNFISFVKKNNINCVDCDKFISIFTTSSNTDKQAIFWILEDISSDIPTFANKTINREIRVTKVDGTNGFIDVVVKDKSKNDLLIEYKWYGGEGAIPQDLFIDEFVIRDLFNTNNPNLIQWRIKGNKLSKETVKNYLTSKLGKQSIEKLLENPTKESKIREWFNLDELDDAINDQNIQYFLNKYYDLIFK